MSLKTCISRLFKSTRNEERIIELEKKLSIIGTEELEDLKHRIGKTELMHAATSKRQNDLFEDAMRNLMKLSTDICIHAMTLAEEKIKEITAHLNLPGSEKEKIMITINGQIKTIYTEKLTYDQIVALAPGLNPQENEKYSITYTDGGDESKPSGTISEKDILLVKPGTAVNVVMISAEGS